MSAEIFDSFLFIRFHRISMSSFLVYKAIFWTIWFFLIFFIFNNFLFHPWNSGENKQLQQPQEKTLLTQSVVLITRYKSGTILFWDETCQFFSKKCHFQIISDVQWWTKKFRPFLDSTYQEWIIFARSGDGPSNYY